MGDLELPVMFDAHDDSGYDGPIKVEMQGAYRTPAVVAETIDVLGEYE